MANPNVSPKNSIFRDFKVLRQDFKPGMWKQKLEAVKFLWKWKHFEERSWKHFS